MHTMHGIAVSTPRVPPYSCEMARKCTRCMELPAYDKLKLES